MYFLNFSTELLLTLGIQFMKEQDPVWENFGHKSQFITHGRNKVSATPVTSDTKDKNIPHHFGSAQQKNRNKKQY